MKLLGSYQVEVTQAIEQFDPEAMEFVCDDKTYPIRIEIYQLNDGKIQLYDALGGIATFDSLEEFMAEEHIESSEIFWK